MKKIFAICTALILTLSGYGQKNEVLKVLANHGIKADVLDNQAKENAKLMSYHVKQTTESANNTKTELASYDGKKQPGQRWTLQSVNGKAANASQVKAFLKAHPEHLPPAAIDENSYQVIKDDQEELIVSFGYSKENLNKENEFLKDCSSKLYINTRTKLLEKQETQNNIPLKIKGIKIPKLLTIVNFNFDHTSKKYFISREQTNLVVQLLIITTDSVITSEYSDYAN